MTIQRVHVLPDERSRGALKSTTAKLTAAVTLLPVRTLGILYPPYGKINAYLYIRSATTSPAEFVEACILGIRGDRFQSGQHPNHIPVNQRLALAECDGCHGPLQQRDTITHHPSVGVYGQRHSSWRRKGT